MLERRFASLPSSEIATRLSRVGLDVDQEENGTALAQLR
jgi:hypothetical protein